MRTPGLRMHPLEYPCTDNIKPAVGAILEPQYLDPRDERMADIKIEPAADQLIGALGPHLRGDAKLAALAPFSDACSERGIVGATDGNAGHVELGHDGQMGGGQEKSQPREGLAFSD